MENMVCPYRNNQCIWYGADHTLRRLRIKRHPLCPAEEEAAPSIEEDDGEIGEPITPEPALSFDEPWI
ncbi:hypothetical protein, partial [Candidatus Thiosymbion oneisti]|uniref:hypothetical protein n=1 Tax=Candidatus Thiosymbion oneisti TaxID=589554 RepID=UPI001A9C9E50